MFTHKPVRNGSDISISIFGENGERFALRIAENVLNDGERLGAAFEVSPDGDRQRFLFHVEPMPPATRPQPATASRRAGRRLSLFRPAPRPALAISASQGIGYRQLF